MKQMLIATAAGLLLAVAGCSQLYEGMRSGMLGDDETPGSRAREQAMARGQDQGSGPGQGAEGGSGALMAGDGAIPDLTQGQRTQLAAIRRDFHREQGALMAQMHRYGRSPGGAVQGGPPDEQAERQAYEARAAIRKQVFENSLQARKRIHSLLTPQQREHWHSRSDG